MINLEGIQIDLATSQNALTCSQAIYIIEFDFNNKLLIGHTYEQTVLESLRNLIMTCKEASQTELAQACLRSKYITLQIVPTGVYDKFELLSEKYKLIYKYKTYYPFGYNALVGLSLLEQSYADILTRKLPYGRAPQKGTGKKGRAPKKIYQYNKLTGALISEYGSIKEAAQNIGLSASNISMCCKGQIRTAGGFIWKYKL